MAEFDREEFLNGPADGMYYHRDGTPAKTIREGLEIMRHRFGNDPNHPDFGRVGDTVIRQLDRRRSIWDHFRRRRTIETRVSTVFLVLNHAFFGGPPLIFETMIFGHPDHDGWQMRYGTEEEAKAGHEAAVAWIRGETDEPQWPADREE